MPDSASIADSVRELRRILRACRTAGIGATVECDHGDVVVGRAGVQVSARIVASADELAALAPVLRCPEIADFGGRPMKARRGRVGEYGLQLSSDELQPDTTYHLALHPNPDAGAIAACTLHTFSERVVATARRHLRDALSPSGRAAAPPRASDTTAPTPQARATRTPKRVRRARRPRS